MQSKDDFIIWLFVFFPFLFSFPKAMCQQICRLKNPTCLPLCCFGKSDEAKQKYVTLPFCLPCLKIGLFQKGIKAYKMCHCSFYRWL